MMSKQEAFKTALSMIQVTPENFSKVTPEFILQVCDRIAEAEKQLMSRPSIYETEGMKSI